MDLIVLIIIIILWMIFLIGKYWQRRKLPPGPWNLPVVGYLPWLDPKSPYLSLTKLSNRFGSIYGLYLGNIYTIVISDAKLIKRIFNKDASSGRAPLHLTHGIMKGYGLICAQGDLWKDQRKFVHTTLRQLGASKVGQNRKTIEALITTNISDLIKFIENNGALDPLEPLRHSLGSIINQLVFGKCWARDDEMWQWLQFLQEEGTKYIGVAGPLNFLPFLRFLPKSKQTIRFLLEGKEKTHKIYQSIIEEQKLKLQDHVNPPENVIQAFLIERQKRDDCDKFYSDQQFYHLLADIFGASLDTTLATLRWYLLYMAVHQDVQEKIRQHLEIFNGKAVTLDDVAMLPYVEATIAEVQRIRSVVPVGIPHGALEPMEIDGYTIPKGTMIVPLQWAIHMNPKFWDEPNQFNPDRFIDNEGRFYKPEAFIPFQSGKRMCVGDELARMLLFLFAANLIQNFHLSCADPDNIDLDGDCGITLTPKPHQIVFQKIILNWRK